MKATGIVRRIDDLGRVIIPKEIRRTIGIKEGDPLEVFTIKENGRTMVAFSLYEANDRVHLQTAQLDSLLSAIERIKDDICDTSPNETANDLENIMDSIRNLYPDEE